MLVYIVIFFLIFLSSLFKIPLNYRLKSFICLLFLVFFVGFRYNVGGDWDAYLYHYNSLEFNNMLDNLFLWDPGYVLLEYIAKFLGIGIYGVNLFCSLLFGLCFLYFVNSFNLRLSYSLLIGFPYLIMVVVCGYSRQGVAIGFVMAMLGAFNKKENSKVWLMYLLAIFFHKTALVAGLIFIFDKKIFNIRNMFFLFIIFLFIYNLFQDDFKRLCRAYFLHTMQSEGAMIRIFINVLAGFSLLICSKEYKKKFQDYDLWKSIFMVSVFILFFTIFTHTSTIGDRILLYFYPLQIIVFNRIIFLIKNNDLKILQYFYVVVFYWGVLLGWLCLAVHRFAWIPYKNILIEQLL